LEALNLFRSAVEEHLTGIVEWRESLPELAGHSAQPLGASVASVSAEALSVVETSVIHACTAPKLNVALKEGMTALSDIEESRLVEYLENSLIKRLIEVGIDRLHAGMEREFSAAVRTRMESKQASSRSPRIPPAKRTRPLTLQEAAKHMGLQGRTKAKTEMLSRMLDAGVVRAEKLSRQSYVFSLDDFPKGAHSKVRAS
jgi:hypothetical protein